MRYTDRSVDPLEGGDLDGLGATAGDDWLVAAARLGDGAEAAEGVAARADETLRPTPGSQRPPALFLGSVGCAKLPLTEAFLELDLVACHGDLLGKAQDVHYLYRTKQAEDST